MTLPNLSLNTIKRAATEKSFDRGQDYFASGAVIELTLRGNTLRAEVEGNNIQTYQVTAIFDEGGITECHCSCPYDWDGWCKHIVATLLTCIHQPETIEERPSLNQLLACLNLEQAQSLIESWVNQDPQLIDSLDFFVNHLDQGNQAPVPSPSELPRKRKTPIDPAPYKKQVRNILQETVQNWDYGSDDDSIADDLNNLLQDALAFAEQGDGESALTVLKGITEGCIEYWDMIDNYVGMSLGEFDVDLDAVWTEVLLSTELTTEETLSWQEEIEGWSDSLGSFAMAIEALRQSWDYPPLQRAFQGVASDNGAWSGEKPRWADEFTQIRLKILDRQQRYEEYLQLAKAEGQTKAYLTMLGRLGRVEQAMTVAKEKMHTMEEAQALAETLRGQNQVRQALEIAMAGLALTTPDSSSYPTAEFARWTSDLAAGLGDHRAQLVANIIAFKAQPSLKEYQGIEALAGDDWPAIRDDLLQHLRHSDNWLRLDAKVDVFLWENCLDDAVKVVSSREGYYHQSLCLKVMDAAISTHSQWVLDSAIAQAELIINAGRAKAYNQAVEWLKRAKAAYCELGREQDWLEYRKNLTNIHGLKRKLMTLFNESRL